MSARLLALCCLLILAVSPGWTGSDSPSSPNVVVYLKTEPFQPSGPVETMKRELNALMSTVGYRLAWRDEGSADRNVDNAELVVVELRGSCGLSARAAHGPIELGSLASTAVSDGKVLPFSWVNCDALARMLGSTLSVETAPRRDFLYGRAMARLLAHELYHVIARTGDHGHDGLTKPAFSRQELLGERSLQTFSSLRHQVLLSAPSNRSF